MLRLRCADTRSDGLQRGDLDAVDGAEVGAEHHRLELEREVRIIGVSEDVKVVGDGRDAVDYEFTVNSTGPDDQAAVGYAKETALTRDDLGDVLVLRARYPDPATQRSTIGMSPRRCALAISSLVGTACPFSSCRPMSGARGPDRCLSTPSFRFTC